MQEVEIVILMLLCVLGMPLGFQATATEGFLLFDCRLLSKVRLCMLQSTHGF